MKTFSEMEMPNNALLGPEIEMHNNSIVETRDDTAESEMIEVVCSLVGCSSKIAEYLLAIGMSTKPPRISSVLSSFLRMIKTSVKKLRMSESVLDADSR